MRDESGINTVIAILIFEYTNVYLIRGKYIHATMQVMTVTYLIQT